MRIFLSLLMAMSVCVSSSNNPGQVTLISVECLDIQSFTLLGKVNNTGNFNGNVLLPCDCSTEAFQWQMEHPMLALMLMHNHNNTEVSDNYKNRVEIVRRENSGDCSVLLKDIKASDQGKYSCRFRSKDTKNITYKYYMIHLSIFDKYTVCMTDDSSGNTYLCDVQGHNLQAGIQWLLNGTSNLASAQVTYTTCVCDDTGYCHLRSKLTTYYPGAVCSVKTEDISPHFNICSGNNHGNYSTVYSTDKAPRSSGEKCLSYFNDLPNVLQLGLWTLVWLKS